MGPCCLFRILCLALAVILHETTAWSLQQRQITIVPRIQYRNGSRCARRQSTSTQHSNSKDEYDNSGESEFKAQEEDGETLLRISLSINPANADPRPPSDDDGIRSSLLSYLQSFPFAAVLPVQPLTYKPTGSVSDGQAAGVEVVFLRKKTMEKGSEDGGIAVLVSTQSGGGMDRLEITAVRRAEGQFVSKVFSEGMIVKALVEGICGRIDDAADGGGSGVDDDELRKRVSVESIYHKWM